MREQWLASESRGQQRCQGGEQQNAPTTEGQPDQQRQPE
jgi:hypothetical protein